MAGIGGVKLGDLDIKAIEQAAGWLAHWEHEENAEGGVIPSPSLKRGTGQRLIKIKAAADKLDSLLTEQSPDGFAAANLSGGAYFVDELRALSRRASVELERCRQEVEQHPKGVRVTTESRKTLVSVITRSWLDAGGDPHNAAWLTNWDCQKKASPLILLVKYVLEKALPFSPHLTLEQIRVDIEHTEWFQQ